MRETHDFILRMYARPNHKFAIEGEFLREMWNDSLSGLETTMSCCQYLLDEGVYSRVEIFDKIDGTYTKTILPTIKAKK